MENRVATKRDEPPSLGVGLSRVLFSLDDASCEGEHVSTNEEADAADGVIQ